MATLVCGTKADTHKFGGKYSKHAHTQINFKRLGLSQVS